jgi:hypothetical protein
MITYQPPLDCVGEWREHLTVEGEGESLDNLGFPERKDMQAWPQDIYTRYYTLYMPSLNKMGRFLF